MSTSPSDAASRHLRSQLKLVPAIISLYAVSPVLCQTSIISRTLVGNQIVDNSEVVGASPVGAAPTTSSFST